MDKKYFTVKYCWDVNTLIRNEKWVKVPLKKWESISTDDYKTYLNRKSSLYFIEVKDVDLKEKWKIKNDSKTKTKTPKKVD